MGYGSQLYTYYYFLETFLFFIITIVSFVLLSQTTNSCNEICPLIIENRPETGDFYSRCLCFIDYNGQEMELNEFGQPSNPDITFTDQERYDNIANEVFKIDNNGVKTRIKNCYICTSDTIQSVYQACTDDKACRDSNIYGFQVATSFINDTTMCNTQEQKANANILISPTVTLRSFVSITLWIIAIGYCLSTLMAFVCLIGYNNFKDKYGPDWGKLTTTEKYLGICCKIFPIFIRTINIVTLFFILITVISIFSYEVCFNSRNNEGTQVFFETIGIFMSFVSIAWLFMCVFGVLFNKFVAKETSFYNPEVSVSKESSIIYRGCCKIYTIWSKYGP